MMIIMIQQAPSSFIAQFWDAYILLFEGRITHMVIDLRHPQHSKVPTIATMVYDGIVNFVGTTSDLRLYYIEPHIHNLNSLKQWYWPSFTSKKCKLIPQRIDSKAEKCTQKFLLVGLILYI